MGKAGRSTAREAVIQNPHRYRGLGCAGLSSWTINLLERVQPQASSFAVRLVDDAEIRELNRIYRKRDRATDVLSFPGGQSPEGLHLGDVVISLPTARAQAGLAGHSLERELKELILHGVLHCLGYDHENDEGAMVEKELRLRRECIGDELR